ncbi:Subunit of the glycosylphosphatidylinositol transamidase complex-like protein [Malassezia yamatoensis]|uniref:Subunit of the glycosylphosphatidylinositol transamidase complex-like protein n=1 Tax=Malassezia yamatoensis TaxID=253288 RepID=A0AAJ6CES8_9BASI|nr:Subunit of the glycosylphosphatidylinositol transamidase complex-like protein [Malassezia yamatoensis]
MRLGVSAVYASVAAVLVGAHETYNESLELSSLPGGRVYSSFAFTLHSDHDSLHHFRILPRALLQPVKSLGVDAFQLTLTAGRWQYSSWGAPKLSQSVASGAEVWATFSDQNDSASVSLTTRWRRLTSALAGTFCASLDAIDETTSVSVPAQYVWNNAPPNTEVLHAYLPSENVCTENLTPLLKLLPCKAGAGLASLIQMHTILSSEFQSMSVHARNSPSGYMVELAVSTVMRPAQRPADNKTWALHEIFSRNLTASCPIANHSEVRISEPLATLEDSDGDWDDDSIHASTPYLKRISQTNHDTTSLDMPTNLSLQLTSPTDGPFLKSAPLQATRQILGFGQERDMVRLTLHNDFLTETMHVVYYDQLPWTIMPLMHTIHANLSLDNMELPQDTIEYRDDFDTPFITSTKYRPSQLRGKMGAMELGLRVPAQSTLHVTYAIIKRHLHYDEHLPGPHRGSDLPPALFVPVSQSASQHTWGQIHRHLPSKQVQAERIYTPASLLHTAVPDFSMPYNIILFYSTFVALFFGSFLNIMVRRYSDVYIEKF